MTEPVAACAPPWHPPQIIELFMPPAARLRISSRHPKREHTDREREAELNREAQARWRVNDKRARVCYIVACDSDVLDMLVGMGQILDTETGDDKIVGKAISDMLAEAAQDWKERKKSKIF